MRKTWRSSKTLLNVALMARALVRSCPMGFSTMTRENGGWVQSARMSPARARPETTLSMPLGGIER